MGKWLPYLVTLLLGAAAAWFLTGRGQVSSAEHRAALDALDLARDSIVTTSTLHVRVDTVTILQTELRIDTVLSVLDGDTIIETTIIRDTVFMFDTTGIHWKFTDSTAAYKLDGVSHANLRHPTLSFTEYSLDVYESRINPRQYRLTLGGGVYAGVPFLAGNVRVGRLWLSGMVGAVSENSNVRPRYGAQVAYAVW